MGSVIGNVIANASRLQLGVSGGANPVALATTMNPGVTVHAGMPMLNNARSRILDMVLSTQVLDGGPIVLKGSGAFDCVIHPGPMMRTSLRATYGGLLSAGRILDARA